MHGWDGHPKEGWFPWLKQELEKHGFDVFVPQMPEPIMPKIEAWVSHLAGIVNKPDKNTCFVGHSIGCQAILRYLETLDVPVGDAVFVAGFFTLIGLRSVEEGKIARPWLKTPIDFEKVKKALSNLVAIFSDDDPFVPLEGNVKVFKEKLGAKIIIKEKQGHFSGALDNCTELPIVLEELLLFGT